MPICAQNLNLILLYQGMTVQFLHLNFTVVSINMEFYEASLCCGLAYAHSFRWGEITNELNTGCHIMCPFIYAVISTLSHVNWNDKALQSLQCRSHRKTLFLQDNKYCVLHIPLLKTNVGRYPGFLLLLGQLLLSQMLRKSDSEPSLPGPLHQHGTLKR